MRFLIIYNINSQLMVIIGLLRAEALHRSESDTPRLTLSAEDAERCPTTSRIIPAPHAPTPPPSAENVPMALCRQLGSENPKQKRHRYRQNQIHQNNLQSLQEQDQGSQQMILTII